MKNKREAITIMQNDRLDPLAFLADLDEYKVKKHTLPNEIYHELTLFYSPPIKRFKNLVDDGRLSYSFTLKDWVFTLNLKEQIVGFREIFQVAGDSPADALKQGVEKFIKLYFKL